MKEIALGISALDALENRLVSGIREYMIKCGFCRLHLGLSGGIDSALAAYLAVKAAGKENTTCLYLPSRFSSQESGEDAAELAANLGCRLIILPIEPAYSAFNSILEGLFENLDFDITEENLQSRIRGTLLMAFANKFNSMLLNAANKSELSMGYCTLYGDTNGALGPIGDIFKTEIYELCIWINEREKNAGKKSPIPPSIIKKAPSAELRPNQKDEDSLPPYEKLDEILKLYLVDKLPPSEIATRVLDGQLALNIIKKCKQAEFKWRQLPPVLAVTTGNQNSIPRNPVRYLYE